MDHGLRCSPQSLTFIVKLPEAPEDKSVPLEVPTVGTELTLKNVLSYPVVYRLRFKARPGAQPSTSRSSKRGKHSIDPREDATGFLPSKTSRSVRVVRDGGGKRPDVPSGPDGSLEVLWCISATSEGADMTEERKQQILNEAKSKSKLKMVRMSIDAILSSPAPRRTALLQPSQTQAPYVHPSRWKHGEWIPFTLTNPTDGNQYPAQFAHVAWNSNDRGGYGEVWKCRIDVQGADQPSSFVAVKSLVLLNETRPPNGETITEPRVRKELEIWRSLRHPYIAPLLGNFNSSTPCFITIWYECGTLFGCIRPKRIDSDRIRILKELTEGLQYLHSNNVIHGDIHNGNVLAREDEAGSIHPIFIDFGLSKMLEDSYNNQTILATSIRQKGRMIYMAPELLRYITSPRHKPSDVYAFALLLLEVASGKTAFKFSSNTPMHALQGSIATGSVKPNQSRFKLISTPFWNLLSECWATESTSRPSIDDIAGRLGAMRGLDCYQRET